MFLVDIERETNRSGTFNLYAIGDLHSDRREFHQRRFLRWREQIISDPTAVCVFVGDAMEGRTPGMKHFDVACIRPDFLHNLDSYVKHSLHINTRLLAPIVEAGVPLVIVEGNHDRYQEYTGYAPMLADRCGAHYLGGEGFIRIRSRDDVKTGGGHTTVVHASHGSGGGKMPGSKVNAMQQALMWLDADVVVAGHVHDGAARVIHKYGVTRKGALALVKQPVAMYRAPSFVERSLPGLVNYAGRKGYPSADEGLQWLSINPQHRTMTRHELPMSPDLDCDAPETPLPSSAPRAAKRRRAA